MDCFLSPTAKRVRFVWWKVGVVSTTVTAFPTATKTVNLASTAERKDDAAWWKVFVEQVPISTANKASAASKPASAPKMNQENALSNVIRIAPKVSYAKKKLAAKSTRKEATLSAS